MIRTFVRKHRAWTAAGALGTAAGLVFLACETPVPSAVDGEGGTETAVAGQVGESGEGQRVMLRGVNSTEGRNEPLVFIDGMLVRQDAWEEPDGARTGDGPPRTLAGITPDDIERIEVIKGDAAVTIYGLEASAGVIRITTKKKK